MIRNQVGIAFAGAGIVAEMHGRGIAVNPNAKLIGAYDPDIKKAEAITRKFGGRVFPDLPDLLADPLVDAVHVLTPIQRHVATAIASLNAGKHVLIEKPVAESHEEIRSLQEAAQRSGRVCMPGHNYIYAPSLHRAKRLIQTGKLGKIASLWIVYNIFHPEEVAAIYGGVLREVCMHHAYSLLYLLGRPRRLSSMTSRVHYESLQCEDQAMITCEMPGGAVANLWCSFAANDPTNDPWTVTYKILGTKGGINYSWNEAQFEDNGGPAWGMPCYEEDFIEEIEHFVTHCILEEKPPLSTLDDAADALSIIEAAERSARRTSAFETVIYK
jgi:predicted dehydrogenase